MTKTIFTALLLIILSCTSYSQIRFNKIIEHYDNAICQNVIVRDDGYIMSLGTGTDSVNRGFMLVKHDLEGNELWRKFYGYPDEAWYDGWENALFNTNDGGFALVGGKLPPEGYYHSSPFLAKFDSNGDSLWTRSYPLENSFSAGFHGIQTLDSGYALCGYRAIFIDSITTDYYPIEALLIKTDSLGNMEWYNTYGTSYDESFNKVIQTDDGGYMLGGETNGYGSSMDWYLVKTDSLGEEEWHRNYGYSNSENEIRGLTAVAGGGGVAVL